MNEYKTWYDKYVAPYEDEDIEFDLDGNGIEANGYYICKWIPVSDHLPNTEHNLEGFLTTVKCYDTYDVFILVYYDGKFGYWDGEKLMPDENVVAWMELPEPYKGGE